ncbi:MAG TPA: nucleotide exchange factor GrpE [Chthoniobacterales bacterium]|nr:nucleotide exchange factor GrpE [Chthoniobacterales bacterium]
MTKTAKAPAQADEFAAAMQQLSAEAVKNPPVALGVYSGAGEVRANQAPLEQLEARLQSFEKSLVERLDKISGDLAAQPIESAKRFERIVEQLAAIRGNESVNQQLFDSLHSELRKYRDNFLHESLQKPFINDLIILYDDLSSLAVQLRSAADEKGGKRGYIAQWRDNLENAIQSLFEILHRFDVREVDSRESVDRSLHKVISYQPADCPEEDNRIVMRLKRGFLWRGKVVRPEEVIAKRCG